MKKALFITTQFPYPLDNGGKIGAYNGISVVSKKYRTTVLSFSEETKKAEEGIQYLQSELTGVDFVRPVFHNVHIRNNVLKLCRVMIAGYLKNKPYIAIKFENRNMYTLIDSYLGKEFFDLIFIDYLNMYQYAEYIKAQYSDKFTNMIFKDHNVEFDLFMQEAKKSKGIKRFVLDLEWKRTKVYEQNAVKNSELVFTVCDENTKYFRQFNEQVFTMKPTYKITDSLNRKNRDKALLYIGNLSWKPNMDGIKWFVANVWPEIVGKVPDVYLDIVGSGGGENPFALIPNVRYHGYVEDLSEMYESHSVFIVPLFEGSGIRIKILEAFNHEIAVVATSMSCETIGVTSGEELLKADNPGMFADSVISLLENEELNNRIRAAAKAFLNTHYSLNSRVDEFAGILDQAL